MKIDTITLQGITKISYHTNGSIREVFVCEKNELDTVIGVLTPFYQLQDARQRDSAAITCYDDNSIKRVMLQTQTVIQTPLGSFPAESVIFHRNGLLKKFFPLNGKLCGFWTEEDEAQLSKPIHISLPFGEFDFHIISAAFYDDSSLFSITLWPNETITVPTPLGNFPVKHGFSLFRDGSIQSVEPATPILVSTPIGEVYAFDKEALGIHSDSNSLTFDQSGNLTQLITSTNIFDVIKDDGTFIAIRPSKNRHPLDDDKTIDRPIRIQFQKDCVIFDNYDEVRIFSTVESEFRIKAHVSAEIFSSCSGNDCSQCSLCK